MLRMAGTRLGTRCEPPNAHLPHGALHALTVHGVTFLVPLSRHPSGSVKGPIGINVIDSMLEGDLVGIRPDGPVIEAGAVEAQPVGLDR